MGCVTGIEIRKFNYVEITKFLNILNLFSVQYINAAIKEQYVNLSEGLSIISLILDKYVNFFFFWRQAT